MTGTVKWYNRRLGYGFIAIDGGGDDVVVHHSQLQAAVPLEQGDRVEFSLERTREGTMAVQVVLTTAGASPADH